MTHKSSVKSESAVTAQGNAPVATGFNPPLEREINARDAWMKWQAKYPFTLDKVDGFILAVVRDGIRPEECFIATPEENDYDRHDSVSEITVHGYNDVRMVCETGYDEGEELTAVIPETVELEAYHRGFNAWVVVPTSQETRKLMVALVEAAKEVQ